MCVSVQSLYKAQFKKRISFIYIFLSFSFYFFLLNFFSDFPSFQVGGRERWREGGPMQGLGTDCGSVG